MEPLPPATSSRGTAVTIGRTPEVSQDPTPSGMLLVAMKKYVLIGALAVIPFSVSAQPVAPVAPPPELATHDQIRAARAKDVLEQKRGPTSRPWDRDANGRRPWETSVIPKTKP